MSKGLFFIRSFLTILLLLFIQNMSSFQPSQPVSQVSLTGSDSTLGKSPVIDSTRLVEAAKALEFFRVVGNLKNLKRTGWIHNGTICIFFFIIV